MTESRYYIFGQGVPTHIHDTVESAMLEAKRLAEKHTGQEFIVMRAICAVKYRTDPYEIKQFCAKQK